MLLTITSNNCTLTDQFSYTYMIVGLMNLIVTFPTRRFLFIFLTVTCLEGCSALEQYRIIKKKIKKNISHVGQDHMQG